MPRRRIVVTGGAGFIGSHVVDRLIAEDSEVMVIDDFSTGRAENLAHHRSEPRLWVERADVTDEDAMRRLLRGADTVYHLAVQCLRLSLYEPRYVHETNATGTLNLCMAALEHGIRRFVYVSSSEVYGSARRVPMGEDHPLNPATPYAASKLAGESYALAYAFTHKLPAVVVRPFNAYGPRAHHEGASGEVIPRFALRVMAGLPPLIFGDGQQTRDFTWVEDTAAGIVKAAGCDRLIGRTVNIAFGQEVTIQRIAELILAAVGRDAIGIVRHDARPGDVRRHFADTRRARRLLNFAPTVSIEDGIRRYVDWLRERVTDPARLVEEQDVINWQPPDAVESPAGPNVPAPRPQAIPAWQPALVAAS